MSKSDTSGVIGGEVSGVREGVEARQDGSKGEKRGRER